MHIPWHGLIAGIVFTGIGIFILSGIWFPRLRGYHKASRVRFGPFSCAAAALIPLVWGLLVIGLAFYPHAFNKLVLLFVVSLIAGIGGSMYGAVLDHRAQKKDEEKSENNAGDGTAGS